MQEEADKVNINLVLSRDNLWESSITENDGQKHDLNETRYEINPSVFKQSDVIAEDFNERSSEIAIKHNDNDTSSIKKYLDNTPIAIHKNPYQYMRGNLMTSENNKRNYVDRFNSYSPLKKPYPRRRFIFDLSDIFIDSHTSHVNKRVSYQ